MAIIKTVWLTQWSKKYSCFGIVVMDNGYEKKAYIGMYPIGDATEEESAQFILKHGAKIYPEQLKQALTALEDNKL